MKYVCKICGYVYDEEKEGVPFSTLPDSWTCPLCGASKSNFEPQGENKATVSPSQKQEYIPVEDGTEKLTPGELSALFSNLARGCEKQYKAKEAELFSSLSSYFAAVTPAVPGDRVSDILGLVRDDTEKGLPAVRTRAAGEGDRGALRACTWTEKVTAIFKTLLERYEKEGEGFLKDTEVWVCTVCGFIYVGDKVPELCPVCKVPARKLERIEGRKDV